MGYRALYSQVLKRLRAESEWSLCLRISHHVCGTLRDILVNHGPGDGTVVRGGGESKYREDETDAHQCFEHSAGKIQATTTHSLIHSFSQQESHCRLHSWLAHWCVLYTSRLSVCLNSDLANPIQNRELLPIRSSSRLVGLFIQTHNFLSSSVFIGN